MNTLFATEKGLYYKKQHKKTASEIKKNTKNFFLSKLQPEKTTLLELVQNLAPHSFADKTVESTLQ